jgi:hypothetical protein
MNILTAAAVVTVLGLLPAVTRADEASTATPKVARPDQMPVDPVSSLRGDPIAWTVSDTSAGCYLLSPYLRDGSRLAFGRHPLRGLGLFLINLAISVPNDTRAVSISVTTEAGAVSGQAKLVAANVLLTPIDKATAASVLVRVNKDGALWLRLGDAWIMHGGTGGLAAVQEYNRLCVLG